MTPEQHVPTLFRRAADLIEQQGWWNGVDDPNDLDSLDVTAALCRADPEFFTLIGSPVTDFLDYLHHAGISLKATISEWNDLECGSQANAVATLRRAANCLESHTSDRMSYCGACGHDQTEVLA